MACQGRGVVAETRHASFHQNIGLLVLRLSRSMEGDLCKNCINRFFWQYSLITFFFGWWGIISFICTPIFLIMNLVSYVPSWGMQAPGPGAGRPPTVTRELATKLQPYATKLMERLGNDEPLDTVAADVAQEAGVTPDEVKAYVAALVQAIQASGKK